MCSAIKSTHWALNANYNIFLCLDLLFSFVKFFLVLFKKIFFYCTYFLSFYFLSLVTWSIAIFYFWLIIHISKFFWFYFCCLLFKLLLNLGDRTSFMISWIFIEKKIIYFHVCVSVCMCKFLSQEWRWILLVSIWLCNASESITSSEPL